MSEHESSSTSGREADIGRLEHKISNDLHALGKRSASEFPTLDTTVQSLRQEDLESKKEGTFMSSLRAGRSRPILITASVIAVLVIALLTVPIPYSKTVGHDVTLRIDGAGLDQSQVMAIAKELKSHLEADQVQVGILAENGNRSYELKANVPTGIGINPARVADAFASNLENLGHSVATEINPVVERTSTTLYAYAQGQVIEISMDGKSSAEIEEEIRQALLASGVTMAQVHVEVNENPDGTEEVRIEVEAECDDSDPCNEHPMIRLTKEGAELDGDFQDVAVRIKKLVKDDGPTSLVAEIVRDGQPVEVEVADADNLSDMELASALESALAQEGVSAQVDIVDGKIEIKLDQ